MAIEIIDEKMAKKQSQMLKTFVIILLVGTFISGAMVVFKQNKTIKSVNNAQATTLVSNDKEIVDVIVDSNLEKKLVYPNSQNNSENIKIAQPISANINQNDLTEKKDKFMIRTSLSDADINIFLLIFEIVAIFIAVAIIFVCFRIFAESLRGIFRPTDFPELKRQNTKILEQMEELKKEMSNLNKEELETQKQSLLTDIHGLYDYYQSRAEEDKIRRILLQIEKEIDELHKKMDKITGEYHFEKYIYDRDTFGGDLSKMKIPTDGEGKIKI